MGDVGLDDISGLEFEELTILIAGMDTLAGRYGDGDLFGCFLERCQVLRWDRLLDPGWFQWLKLARHLYSSCRADSGQPPR